jgi:lipoprotein-anchoring transpeptidase ErfK/SrfK
MWTSGRACVAIWSVVVCAAVLPARSAGATAIGCANVLGGASVAGPTRTVAWRAEIETPTAVYYRLAGNPARPSRWLGTTNALWLLVLAPPRFADDRCWLRLRLPWRPNNAAGWVDATDVTVERTPWRIEVSTARRTLTLFRGGASVRTVSVVVGKPSTRTPRGEFAIVWAIPWYPDDFLGSWVLELTAHSDALKHFDGGDGTVGIHGRGGTSLLDPLGSALSHGCIRLENDAIDWLVHTIGETQLPGTPVQVS